MEDTGLSVQACSRKNWVPTTQSERGGRRHVCDTQAWVGHKFLAELRRKLPFEATTAVCDGNELIQLEMSNPFGTAKGKTFDVTGIPPDFSVPVYPEDEVVAGRDKAPKKALEILGVKRAVRSHQMASAMP